MKKINKIIAFISLFSLLFFSQIISTKAQFAIDTTSNFYEITAYWDYKYDSIMNVLGAENMEGTGYKHYMHWKAKWEPLVQPDGDFKHYFEAIEGSYGCFSSLGYYSTEEWEEVGPVTSFNQPTDDVGRLSCIEVDPEDSTIVLCGSPEGGLYYTENSGLKWKNAGLDHPNEDHGLDMFTPGIASIIISYVDNTTYWIVATGDKDHTFSFSRGVLRSTDKGENWELINGSGNNKLPGNWYYIRKLIQHPNNPNIIFAATSRGLYKTENALADANEIEWNIVDDEDLLPFTGPGNDIGFFDIEFHKSDPDIMFLTVEYRANHEIGGNELLWSEDGGDNWETMPGAADPLPEGYLFDYFLTLFELTLANTDLMYAYVKGTYSGSYYNAMWKYEIEDQIWTQINLPFSANSDGNGRNGFAVSPVNENLLYAATVDTYVSNDGGLSWNDDNDYNYISTYEKKYPHSDVQDLKFNATGTEIWAASDGGPFYKDLRNPEWENRVNTIGITLDHYFDQSKIDPNYYIFGGYDVHSQLYDKEMKLSQYQWIDKGNGDGYGCAFDNEELGTFYVSNVGVVYRYENWQLDEPCGGLPQFWTRHVTINTEDNNTIYTSSGSVVNRSYNRGSDWEVLVTLPQIYLPDTYVLWDVHVAEANPDYLYLRVNQPEIGYPAIFKTENSDKTPGEIVWELLPSIPQGWLGDIEVDYENPDRIWACFNMEGVDKVWEYNGSTWIDLTGNLNECNSGISSLAHLHGTDRALFAGGLHGVFYLEDGTDDWIIYKTGIPNVSKPNLKINYCSGKVIAGTKGRGMWETGLPEGWNDPIVLSSDETWNGYRVVFSQVTVPAGKTLTITGEVNFMENADIVVERGGKLIVDGGLLTNYSCSGLWPGIELWGHAGKGQTYNYQGTVEIINGGTIENAICAINTIRYAVPDGGENEAPDYAYTGGMVLADGGIFKNNNTAVKFWRYTYSTSASFFRDCQFITDDNLLDEADPDIFIEIKDISGIDIAGSSFMDTRSVSDPIDLTSGIESFGSRFSVFSYQEQPSVFSGLYEGVRALTHDPTKSVNIRNSRFTDNLRSVYLSSMIGAVITGNEFNPWTGEVPAEEDNYCLYLDFCTGYTIEENDFSYTESPTGIGLVINNSGPHNNEVYNNNFTRLEYATLAENCNRSSDPDIGLVIKCNDYWHNYQDIAVTADEEVDYPGIALNQGAPGATDQQAGNRFSLNNNGNDISDYSTFILGPINYYHHKPDPEPRVKPEYISDYINLEEQLNPYYEELSCPPNESGGGGGGIGDEELKGRMAESEFKADSTQAILTALVDGGNTEVLEQEVLQSMPPETYDLYMSLMGKSPYLSDSVLMAAIEKENVLPNVLIKDILVANPQSAKSNEVMEKVDEKSNPLDEDLLAEVLLGQYIVAAKEKLEAYLAYYKHRRSTALKYLKQLYRNDTVNAWAHDSLIFLLESENGLNEKYELVFEYIAMDNWTAANNLLGSLPASYLMNTQQQEIYQEMQQFTGVLLNLHQMDSTIYNMPGTLKTTLYDLADNSQSFPGAIARNILIEVDGYDYTEPVILPEASLKSGNIVFDLPNIKTFTPEYVKIYPNPALDYIIVELNTGNATGAVISLFDNQGKQIQRVNIPAQQQHYVLGLKDIPTGMYVVKVDCNGKNLGSKKFNIVK